MKTAAPPLFTAPKRPGNPGRIKSMLMNWVRQLDAAWSNRADIASDLLANWNDDSAWDRGQFQGKALGWVAMTAILAAVTGGAVLVAKAGRFATIASALDRVGALGDVTTYVGKGIRLPGNAADAIRKRLGGNATADTATGGDGAGRSNPPPVPSPNNQDVVKAPRASAAVASNVEHPSARPVGDYRTPREPKIASARGAASRRRFQGST